MKKYLSEIPKLANEWHPTKNKDLKPEDVSWGSNRRVWWKCPKGDDHEWEAIVQVRVKHSNCPFCINNKVSSTNSLFTLFPSIAMEWHPIKNGELSPKKITYKSSKKVWWKCSKGDDHEWKTTVYHRTIEETKCPFCSNNKLSKINSFRALYPELSNEWHPTKNGSLKPDDIIGGTAKKKVWWKCITNENHVWEETIANRVIQKKCPFCSKRQGFLPTGSLAAIRPGLIEFWNDRKNSNLTPFDIIAGSDKKYWWVCPDNKRHEWLQSPYLLTHIKNITKVCPFCNLRKLSVDNNLSVMFPKIATEFHQKKNGSLSPEKLLPNSMKKVWWRCKNKHEWQATVRHRAIRGQNCPSCTRQSSIPEIRIYTELMTIFKNIENRKKIDGVEVDIFMPSISSALEYDGSYFHKSKVKGDLKKNEFLKSKSIDIFRVRELPMKKLSENDILVLPTELTKNDMNQILINLLPKASQNEEKKIQNYLNQTAFVNEKDFKKYLSYFPSPFPEDSIKQTHPHLVAMWHEKNLPLNPSNFSFGTPYKAWWQCPKIKDHVWKAQINKVSDGHGCPYCTGQKADKDNNLQARFPEIAAQWHPTRNGNKSPLDFTWASGEKFWWQCPKGDDHEWKTAIRHRTSNNSGCPFCSGNKVSKDYNLLVKYPEIAKEWHPTRNGNLRPDQITPYTGKKVWWICSKNHDWQAGVVKRTRRGQNCNICKFK